jgi:UDP:flavonoid glycosyltransferase YjiC (YdhE family)
MRVLLAPVGTRGDVEPMLALADALRARGHACTLAASAGFAETARAAGLPFASLGPGFDDIPPGVHNEFEVLRRFLRTLGAQYDALVPAAREADVVIGAMLALAGPSAARLAGVPWLYAGFSPHYLRSRELVPGGVPIRRLPRAVLGAFNVLQDLMLPLGMPAWVAEERKLGLPAPRGVYPHMAATAPLLLAYDEVLLPTPRDAQGTLHRVGVMRRDGAAEALAPEVEAFLDAGPPPVYVGFGSMRHEDALALGARVRASARRTGTRVVLAGGWSGLRPDAADASVLAIGGAPHDLLFPRCAGIVHHGGAGTLHAAALAGRPQAIVHHWADQIHHGWRTEALGIGVAPTMIRRLSDRWLDDALARLSRDGPLAERAAAFARTMGDPRAGARRAAAVVEAVVRAHARAR